MSNDMSVTLICGAGADLDAVALFAKEANINLVAVPENAHGGDKLVNTQTVFTYCGQSFRESFDEVVDAFREMYMSFGSVSILVVEDDHADKDRILIGADTDSCMYSDLTIDEKLANLIQISVN